MGVYRIYRKEEGMGMNSQLILLLVLFILLVIVGIICL
nr:YjcZ family sporulation protein [Bacillus cereus group sp. BfR-BA-01352]